MNCSACGKELYPGNKFCPGCGATLVAHAVAVKKKNSGLWIVIAGAVALLFIIIAISDFGHAPSPTSPVAAQPAESTSITAIRNREAMLLFQRGRIPDAAAFQHYCGKAASVDDSAVNTLLTYPDQHVPGTDLTTALEVSYIHQIIVGGDNNPHFGGHSHKVVFILGMVVIKPEEAIRILGCEGPPLP